MSKRVSRPRAGRATGRGGSAVYVDSRDPGHLQCTPRLPESRLPSAVPVPLRRRIGSGAWHWRGAARPGRLAPRSADRNSRTALRTVGARRGTRCPDRGRTSARAADSSDNRSAASAAAVSRSRPPWTSSMAVLLLTPILCSCRLQLSGTHRRRRSGRQSRGGFGKGDLPLARPERARPEGQRPDAHYQRRRGDCAQHPRHR